MNTTTSRAKNSLAAVEATVELAETPDEKQAAKLWRTWAVWSRRFNDRPTPANDYREAVAWAALVLHVDAAGLTHSAFDPRD